MKDFSKEYRESLNYYREYEENDVKSELDSLFDSVKEYRTSQFYRDTLDFCRRFKQLAPFNAMMVTIDFLQTKGSVYPHMRLDYAELKVQTIQYSAASKAIFCSLVPTSLFHHFPMSLIQHCEATSSPSTELT